MQLYYAIYAVTVILVYSDSIPESMRAKKDLVN